jgi:hypothetical protein
VRAVSRGTSLGQVENCKWVGWALIPNRPGALDDTFAAFNYFVDYNDINFHKNNNSNYYNIYHNNPHYNYNYNGNNNNDNYFLCINFHNKQVNSYYNYNNPHHNCNYNNSNNSNYD